MIGRFIGKTLLVEAAFLAPALLISMFFQETKAARAFFITIIINMVVAGVMLGAAKGAQKGFHVREGLVCVGISWIAMSVLGCLPFFLSGAIPNYVDALFETVSGFTTTGASIL